MKPFRLAAALPLDLQAACDFYAARSAPTAERFLAAYVTTRDHIMAQPLLHRVRPHGWRQVIIPRFPHYAIFYKETETCWLIGGVPSLVRDPDNVLAALLLREAIDDPE